MLEGNANAVALIVPVLPPHRGRTAPLGYQLDLHDDHFRAGFMRSQIPVFRLPPRSLMKR